MVSVSRLWQRSRTNWWVVKAFGDAGSAVDVDVGIDATNVAEGVWERPEPHHSKSAWERESYTYIYTERTHTQLIRNRNADDDDDEDDGETKQKERKTNNEHLISWQPVNEMKWGEMNKVMHIR